MPESLLLRNEAPQEVSSTPMRPSTTTKAAAYSMASQKAQKRTFSTPNNPRSSITPLRKKACGACSAAKVRCDLSRPRCSRCNLRNLPCKYAHTTQNYGDGQFPQVSTTPEEIRPSRYQNTAAFASIRDSALIGSSKAASPQSVLGSGAQTYSPVSELNVSTSEHNAIDLLQFADLTGAGVDGDSLQTSARASLFGTRSSVSYAPPTLLPLAALAPHFPSQDKKISPSLDLTSPHLVCTVDAARVRDRWFRDFEPPAGQQPIRYSPGVLHFASRVLRSFPKMMSSGDITALPPIIHPAQMNHSPVPTPLVNCITLTRMWEGKVHGGEALVRTTIKGEMERLLKERRSYDQLNLLAAFQAYMLYTILLYFPADGPLQQKSDKATENPMLDEGSHLDTRLVMINLQEIAYDLTLTGLMCTAELPAQARTINHGDLIPDLSSWILAATKRRALLAMYILDSSYCNIANLLWFNAEEIGSLPAPGNKMLWNASIRCSNNNANILDTDAEWRAEYKRYLAVWEGADGRAAPLRIEEFWPDKVKTDELGGLERAKRVAQWVGEVDEFGMMLFAVTGVTYL